MVAPSEDILLTRWLPCLKFHGFSGVPRKFLLSAIENNGEPGGARTRDHRIKSAMLYQLSYRLALEK